MIKHIVSLLNMDKYKMSKDNELFEKIVKKFKDLILLLKNGSNNTDNPFQWMSCYFKEHKNIINFFDSIDENYCKKYNEDRINKPNEPTKHPKIYVDFKNYTTYLMEEKYEKLNKLRNKIFNDYNI